MGQTVESVVDGGKASAGPPLGPALGPTGINIGQVIAAINEKTKSYNGMKVPIKVIIDDKKNFEIEVGTPPMSALVMMKSGIKKGSGEPKKEMVGNLTIDLCKEIVDMKMGDLQASNVKQAVREVVGTCVSMGVTVEGKNPREFQTELGEGKYDSQF